MTRRVAFGLGANLGDPLAALQGGVDLIAAHPDVSHVRVSPVYITAPVGGVEQPDYLNAVLVADTTLSPLELLELAWAAEQAFGRTREVRWGPRTLDVDVLALGDVVSDDARVLLPHPRAHERAFVLVPWSHVDPDALLPGRGTVTELLTSLPPADVASVVRSDAELEVAS